MRSAAAIRGIADNDSSELTADSAPVCCPVPRADAEELANTVSHALGFALSVAGLVLLLPALGTGADVWHQLNVALYGLALLGVYGASTLSHGVQHPPVRRFFVILDQAFIYLLITGTYSVFACCFLREGYFWALTSLMWIVALSGFISKIFFEHRIHGVSIPLYVLLGWLPAAAMPWILPLVPTPILLWILFGGISFTIGTIFLYLDKRDYFFHTIWHTFVLLGTACHFWAIYIATTTL